MACVIVTVPVTEDVEPVTETFPVRFPTVFFGIGICIEKTNSSTAPGSSGIDVPFTVNKPLAV